MLDLCFVTHPDVVHLCQVIPGLSDYDAVLLKFSHRVHINKKQPRKVPLYKNANWDAIRQDFSVMSEEYLQLNSVSHMSVEEIWHYFHDHVMNSVNKHVPSKVLSTRFHLPWLTVTVKHLIRKKQTVYNRARRYQRECDWKEYKILRYKIRNQLRDLHKNHLTKVISSVNNKKPLWHYIKSKRQDHTGVSTLRVNGTVISDSISKVEALNQHFKSVFTIEETDNLPDKGISPYPAISHIEITVPGIYNLLSNCNPHKSLGPDNVHNYVLRETATDIAPLLTHLFQQSLRTGTLPNDWKRALVTPIFKKGKRSDPKNYQPVSLTSAACKTMEHVIVSHIMKHLEFNNILSDTQFGFRSRHSCETQLLITIDDLARALITN